MSLWDRIDAESKEPLEGLWTALPGGLNGIADIVARRQAMSAFRNAAPKAEFPQLSRQRAYLSRTRWRAELALVSTTVSQDTLSGTHLHSWRRHGHG